MSEPTRLQLIEKIVRAKVKIEGLRRDHSSRCGVEIDEACTCGADENNSAVNKALEELKLE